MNFKKTPLIFSFLFLSLQLVFALPTTQKNNANSSKTISAKKEIVSAKKTKKGFFKRIGHNFVVKRVKKMVAKHFDTTTSTSASTSFSEDIANADDQEIKDAKLIGYLLGALLGLFGILGIAIFFEKGPRKKAALRAAWIAFGIAVALVLILSL